MRRCTDEAAVSDVLGSVLLVGITVLMAAGFGVLLFQFDGPATLAHSDLSVVVDPGSGGWATGDETVRIVHRGGDPITASATRVLITRGATTTTLTGTSLGSVFADGRLSIGETWQYPATIAQGESIGLRVVNTERDASVLLAESTLVAAATTSTQPCISDNVPPTVALWSQTPGLLTQLYNGTVTLVATLTDGCWGVNQATVPHLFYRLNPGTNPAYTDLGVMTSVGVNQWRAVIPTRNYAGTVGQQLQVYMSPVSDLGGNSGATAVRSVTVLSDCSTDITPPSVVSNTQSPADVKTTTLTAVTVTTVFTDNCAGVDQATAPHLWYRVNSGSNPSYTDAGAMSLTATSTWQGTIPNPTWALFSGQTLEYYVQGTRDVNGNVLTTSTYSDVIEILATYSYVDTNTVTTGTVTTFANAQSASDSGATAVITEAGTAGSPTTQSFNANGVINANGWVSAGGSYVGASDNVYATYASNSPGTTNDLQASLQDPATTTGTITRVVLSAELSIVGYNNDGFQLQACLNGGSCTAYGTTGGQSSTDVTMTYDITAIRPGGGSWSWTDITNLEGVVHLIQQGTRDGTWRVDRMWADVTFVTTTYSTSVRFDWTTNVPSGITQTLEVRNYVVSDTYTVQVCTWVAGACTTWNTRGTLSSTTLATFSYTLLSTELSAGTSGKVAIRFIDVTTGTTQGNLYVDYARVVTV